MAYTEQEKLLLASAIPALPAEVQALLNNKATADTLEAFSSIMASQRRGGLESAVQVVDGTVSNWTAINTAATYADGAATIEALRAFNSALPGSNATALVRTALVVALTARKYFGVTS